MLCSRFNWWKLGNKIGLKKIILRSATYYNVTASLCSPYCADRCLYGIEALGPQTWRSPHGSGASSRLAQKTTVVFSELYSVCVSLHQVAAGSIRLAAGRILESIGWSQELYYHSWWNNGLPHLPIGLGRGKSFPRDWGYCSEGDIKQRSVIGTDFGFG